MAFPPAVLPTNRTNATAQLDNHPADHNAIAAAINDTVAKIQSMEVRRAAMAAFAVTSAINVPLAPIFFPLQTVVRNEGGMHNPAAGNFIIPEAGWYDIQAHALLNYNSAAVPTVVIVEARVNSTADHASNLRQQFSAFYPEITDFSVSGPVWLNATDTVGLWLGQKGGANVVPFASNASAQSTYIRIVKVA